MLILGLLSMYFDAAVVFVTKSSLLFRLAVAILCSTTEDKLASAVDAIKVIKFSIPSYGPLEKWTEHSIKLHFAAYPIMEDPRSTH